MKIIISLISIVGLVFINILFSRKGRRAYWLFELSHFIGGFILAALFFNFLDRKLVLLAVLVIGVIWEIHELIINRNKTIKKFLEKNFKYYLTPSKWPDILLDLFLDILGAILYVYILGNL